MSYLFAVRHRTELCLCSSPRASPSAGVPLRMPLCCAACAMFYGIDKLVLLRYEQVRAFGPPGSPSTPSYPGASTPSPCPCCATSRCAPLARLEAPPPPHIQAPQPLSLPPHQVRGWPAWTPLHPLISRRPNPLPRRAPSPLLPLHTAAAQGRRRPDQTGPQVPLSSFKKAPI